MNLLWRFIILVFICRLAVPASAPAQATSERTPDQPASTLSTPDAAALQQKATEAEARIRANEADLNLLKKAVKINEVGLAKEILLRSGFDAKDLENAKISLRTGGGKGGEDSIALTATCCDPKEITIQRTLENFTKANR